MSRLRLTPSSQLRKMQRLRSSVDLWEKVQSDGG